jgi:hypothetical protein
MAVNENVTVPYHQQDTDVYCGAACAQMVLDSVGAGLLNQDDLYTDERNHTSELASWYNPPDGLQWVMNDRRPAGFGGWFALFALNTEDAISRKLVWTIHHYQVAPIALVLKGDHWIAVRGYEASAAPTSSADTSYTITAFEVNDPWPPVPSFYAPPVPPPPPPPPHGGTDGCGTGGNRGVANEHIAYATWQSTYMTGNKYGTLWNGRNVAVCDPDPPAERLGQMPPAVKRLRGESLLKPAEAVEYGMAGLRLYRLHERKGWQEALKDTKPGTPVLVQRLDQIDSFYYIVPLESREKTVTAAVAVDARFGDYRQTIALPEGGSSILTALDERRVREMTVGRRLQLEEPLRPIMVRKEAFCLYPTLVWRPCLESLSPFYPFHMITVGDYRIYVRVDGQIITTLHTDIPGI